ncbi:MAG: glycosyltransferase family 4 protein [Bacilli bacterium]|nr:glycosyltransferase family 4 protein [Bacilli bacterium]
MKILFISSDYPRPEKGSNIYTDLAQELNNSNHVIKVVVSEEKKKIDKTELFEEYGVPVLRVRSGNLYEVGFVEKTWTFLNISRHLKKGIRKFFSGESFDLILFQSPPVTFNRLIAWAMRKYKCKSYLMMKDIFPQNGVDIGLYSKINPIYWYFRSQEKKLYKTSSYIGCMSQGNIDYLLSHNKYLSPDKMELFPNTVKVGRIPTIDPLEKEKIRGKYGLNKDDVVAIFGGNFGKPQGLDFLLNILNEYKYSKRVKFILIGRGTEKNRIFGEIKEKGYSNVYTFDFVPRSDYEKLTLTCDIGLIFLDSRFTIPNYPSKTLSYFESSLPIMAAIDSNTDYGKMLEVSESGFWVENGNIKAFKNKFDKLVSDKKLRILMGKNGRSYYEKECNVEKSVKIIESHEEKKNV